MTSAIIPRPFTATPKQLEAAQHWHDPACLQLLVAGAIRSGKSQAAGRLIVETAVQVPTTFLVARSTYRELEDSTKKQLLYGDGNLPPLIPPELIPLDGYRASDNLVRLKTGATLLFRSLEEGQIGKLLNLTLGGVFVDQIEELDLGSGGERIYDTLLGRLSDPLGPRKLLAVANPASTLHWVYRRFVNEQTRDPSARYVHVSMSENVANLPADYVAQMDATRRTRPHWFKTFVLGEWGAFEGAAYTEFADDVHVVAPFEIPVWWERFESMDHGANNPTAWHAWAADGDGNLVVFDEYYSPGLVSRHAPEIVRRRAPRVAGDGPHGLNWWEARGEPNVVYADPSVRARHGLSDQWGAPASIETEYADHGVRLSPANNDRAAGHLRLLELLHIEPGRIAPPWSHVPSSAGGAPRLYVFSSCGRLVEQLKSAPIAADGAQAGECVDPKWESAHGHAHASARYGALSRPAVSERPRPLPELAERSILALQMRTLPDDDEWRHSDLDDPGLEHVAETDHDGAW